jgi:hypothetical protein
MGSATTPTVVSIATMPTSMTDAEATRLGLKEYAHGGSYVSGLAPTITLSGGGGTLGTVWAAKFIPYQKQDGGWRVRFNLSCSISSIARTLVDLTVAGMTSKNISAFYQTFSSTSLTGAIPIIRTYIAPNSGILHCEFSSATIDFILYSGDVELDLKPLWAY